MFTTDEKERIEYGLAVLDRLITLDKQDYGYVTEIDHAVSELRKLVFPTGTK